VRSRPAGVSCPPSVPSATACCFATMPPRWPRSTGTGRRSSGRRRAATRAPAERGDVDDGDARGSERTDGESRRSSWSTSIRRRTTVRRRAVDDVCDVGRAPARWVVSVRPIATRCAADAAITSIDVRHRSDVAVALCGAAVWNATRVDVLRTFSCASRSPGNCCQSTSCMCTTTSTWPRGPPGVLRPIIIIIILTRLPSNLRPTTRECVHLVTCAHFRSRNKDGGHTIYIRKPHDARKLHGSMFYRTGLLSIEVLHCSNGNFEPYFLL